jgi:hypothetical protein
MRIAFLSQVRHVLCMAVFMIVALTASKSSAQDIKVRGGFFEDSVVVGDVVRFYLAAEYPSKLNVLFPDSTFSYKPLEYDHKQYFTTKTSDGISYDSVIYHLGVFELDSLQLLALPVFQVNEKDCTQYFSNPGALALQTVIHDLKLDTLELGKLPLKESVAYHPIPAEFNFPVFFFVVATLLIVTALVWFIFGKRIRKHFRIKRMTKAHQLFIQQFSHQISSLDREHSARLTESTVAHWKKYMEQLERKPYTKLTSKEIQRIEKDETLGGILHAIDASIYGHQSSVSRHFDDLKTFAQQRFNKKLEEVKNG